MAKVMVVDDDEYLIKAVKMVLEMGGYDVVTATSGPEALEKLRAGENPDLVLIDFFMPVMTGRELCENIRNDSALKSLKVAFLTSAQFAGAGMEELNKLDVLDYIKKPFDNADLLNRVKKILG